MTINSYLEKLHVKHIGLFNLLNVKFNPKMNILIGANGSGKTSILRLITHSLSTNDSLAHSRWRPQAEVWTETYWKGTLYKSGFSFTKGDVNEGYRQHPFSRGDILTSPIQRAPNSIYVIGAYRYFDYKRLEGMKREAIGEDRKKYYLENATRFLDSVLLPDIKQWMINSYFAIDKDWSIIQRQNWETIMASLPKLTPHEMDFQFVRIERDLEPVFKLKDKECYLEELSSGFKSFLAIVFSMIDWCEGVNEGDEALMQHAHGTVLIDEIDAHLHPQWQSKMIGNLKLLFPAVQFIVTTHSPLTIASAEANEVIKIPPHEGELELQPERKSYQGWQLDFILEDLMNVVDYQPVANIDKLLDKLKQAEDENDLTKYDACLAELATILHPDDPLLTVYRLKRSNLILRRD
jgi:energy-coupling factor transporter ATP-binding protein EcfA2